MSKFEELCEGFGIIKQTKRIMYPKQISFSEEFKQALKNEYYRLTLEEDAEHPIKNRPEKFLKALQFHVVDLERNKENELAALRAMMDENTDEYKVTVKGEKQEGCKCSDNSKKENQRRKEVEKENMESLKESIDTPNKRILEVIFRALRNKINPKIVEQILQVANTNDKNAIIELKNKIAKKDMFGGTQDERLKSIFNVILFFANKGVQIQLPTTIDELKELVKTLPKQKIDIPPGPDQTGRGTAANRYYDATRGFGAFGQAYHGD